MSCRGGTGSLPRARPDDLACAHEVLRLEPALQLVGAGSAGFGQVAQGLGNRAIAVLAGQVGGVRRAGTEGGAAAVHEVDQVLERRRWLLRVVVVVVVVVVVGLPQRAAQALGDGVTLVLGQALVEPAGLVDVAEEHVHRGDGRVLALGIDGEHVAVGARAQLLGAPAGLAIEAVDRGIHRGRPPGGLRLGLADRRLLGGLGRSPELFGDPARAGDDGRPALAGLDRLVDPAQEIGVLLGGERESLERAPGVLVGARGRGWLRG
jgi:hypothetical protein